VVELASTKPSSNPSITRNQKSNKKLTIALSDKETSKKSEVRYPYSHDPLAWSSSNYLLLPFVRAEGSTGLPRLFWKVVYLLSIDLPYSSL
jgi:hypothetical protein